MFGEIVLDFFCFCFLCGMLIKFGILYFYRKFIIIVKMLFGQNIWFVGLLILVFVNDCECGKFFYCLFKFVMFCSLELDRIMDIFLVEFKLRKVKELIERFLNFVEFRNLL